MMEMPALLIFTWPAAAPETPRAQDGTLEEYTLQCMGIIISADLDIDMDIWLS